MNKVLEEFSKPNPNITALRKNFTAALKLQGNKGFDPDIIQEFNTKLTQQLSKMDENTLSELTAKIVDDMNPKDKGEYEQNLKNLTTPSVGQNKSGIISQIRQYASGKAAILLLAFNMLMTSCDPYRNVGDEPPSSSVSTSTKADRTENSISIFENGADINTKDQKTGKFVLDDTAYHNHLKAKKQLTQDAFDIGPDDSKWETFTNTNTGQRIIKVSYKSPDPNADKIVRDNPLTNTHVAMIATALMDDIYRLTESEATRISELYRQGNFVKEQKKLFGYDVLYPDGYKFDYTKYRSARNTYCNTRDDYKNLDEEARQEKFDQFTDNLMDHTLHLFVGAYHLSHAQTLTSPSKSYDNSLDNGD